MTNTTLNFFRLCIILEPMQELMSRQKAYSLTPRDCLKTTLFQKWQRMMPQGLLNSFLTDHLYFHSKDNNWHIGQVKKRSITKFQWYGIEKANTPFRAEVIEVDSIKKYH